MERVTTTLEERLRNPELPQPGTLWKHYKGDIYIVKSVGFMESTLELHVVYEKQTTESQADIWTLALKKPLIWIRPLSEWNEVILQNDIAQRRFTPI